MGGNTPQASFKRRGTGSVGAWFSWTSAGRLPPAGSSVGDTAALVPPASCAAELPGIPTGTLWELRAILEPWVSHLEAERLECR